MIKRQLENKVAIITGGSHGIGASIARRLAYDGASIVIIARGKEDLDIVANDIKSSYGSCDCVAADARDESEVKRVLDFVAEKYGSLNILVNNIGGVEKFSSFPDLDLDDWRMAFENNVIPIVSFIKHALPLMEKSKGSSIVNISSISGLEPGFFNPHYASTKAATINLTKYLANTLAQKSIRVNAVCAGPVHSRMWMKNCERLAKEREIDVGSAYEIIEEEESSKIPLGFIGEGCDVASAVSFLASDEARWVTGSAFRIDGGKSRSV